MSIVHIKDNTELVGRLKLMSHSISESPNGCPTRGYRNYYIMAYLWKTQRAMLKNTKQPLEDTHVKAISVHSQGKYRISDWHLKCCPLISEVHFQTGGWDESVVVHELMHALMNRMHTTGPPLFLVAGNCEWTIPEEEVCYEMGDWLPRTLNWLREVDNDKGFSE